MILVSDGVHQQIHLLAAAWRTSEGEAVRRLLEEFAKSKRSDSATRLSENMVPIHAVYAGSRIDAVYHRDTKRVDITSGVLAGKSYNRPSGAAVDVVHALNPNVKPHRNGWSFWMVTETGRTLQSIR